LAGVGVASFDARGEGTNSFGLDEAPKIEDPPKIEEPVLEPNIPPAAGAGEPSFFSEGWSFSPKGLTGVD